MFSNLYQKPIKINILGQEREVKFDGRNIAAAEDKFGKNLTDLLPFWFSNSHTGRIQMIWATTLEFEPYADEQPWKIKSEVPMEDLWKMQIGDIIELGKQCTNGIIKSLPQEEDVKKEERGVLKTIIRTLENLTK